MKRHLPATLTLLALAALSRAEDYGIRSDWSFPVQPSNWLYGTTDSDIPVPNLGVTRFTVAETVGSVQRYGLGGPDPNVRLNLGNGSDFGNPPDTVAMHPAPGNQMTIIRFIAPSNLGAVSIRGFMTGTGGGAVDRYVVKNSSTATPTTLFSPGAGPGEFDLTATLLAGDTVDFLVGSAGNYNSDTTSIDATITPVPEPASMLALVAGLGGFVARRQARRN